MGLLGSALGSVTGIFGAREQRRREERRMREIARATQELRGRMDAGPLRSVYGTQGANAQSILAGLLGAGGDAAASRAALDNFLDSANYQSALRGGRDAVTGSAAAQGMLRSGATLRALDEAGQETARTMLSDYMDRLTDQSNRGLSAEQTYLGNDQNLLAMMFGQQAPHAQRGIDATSASYGLLGNFFAQAGSSLAGRNAAAGGAGIGQVMGGVGRIFGGG